MFMYYSAKVVSIGYNFYLFLMAAVCLFVIYMGRILWSGVGCGAAALVFKMDLPRH
jgi:hypothetical protein